MHMLAAEGEDLRHATLAGDDASKYDNHGVFPKTMRCRAI
jgi:hypothetical protein